MSEFSKEDKLKILRGSDIYPTSYHVRFDTMSFYWGWGTHEWRLMCDCHKKCLILSAFPFWGASGTKWLTQPSQARIALREDLQNQIISIITPTWCKYQMAPGKPRRMIRKDFHIYNDCCHQVDYMFLFCMWHICFYILAELSCTLKL